MKKIILLSIILALIKKCFNQCSELLKIIKNPEIEISNYINKNINNYLKDSKSCINILLSNGKLSSLDNYLNNLQLKKIKFTSDLLNSINTFKKKLLEINTKFKYSEKDYQIISPAFKWAQNLNEIFIEIKFSHRFDSPGCIEIKNLKVSILKNTVNLIGYCVLGDIPIKINFKIETLYDIDYQNSNHGFFGLVGRYQFTLKKKISNKYWEKLLSKNNPVFTNMGIWFEMKEKYESEIKKFEDEKDDQEFKEEYERIQKKAEMKRERKQKKKMEKERKKLAKKRKELFMKYYNLVLEYKYVLIGIFLVFLFLCFKKKFNSI